jgi:tetratricopeptide (TPR) repeat protein
LKKAIESYQAALKIKPKDVEVLNICGHVCKDYGDFETAIQCYKKALEFDLDLADTEVNLKRAIEKKTEFDTLIDNYVEHTKLTLDAQEVYNYYGTILQLQGFSGAAIDKFTIAIENDKMYSEAFNNLGMSLICVGDLEAAIFNIKEAIKINSEYANAYINLGIAFGHTNDFEAAIKNLKHALKIKPDSPEAHLGMSMILDKKGDFLGAIQSCNQALSMQLEKQDTEIEKKIRINFIYLSSNGLMDQTIRVFETNANSGHIATELLKERLKGGLNIRIRKVEDLSPKIQLTVERKIKDKFMNKSPLQIFFLASALTLVFAATIARLISKM